MMFKHKVTETPGLAATPETETTQSMALASAAAPVLLSYQQKQGNRYAQHLATQTRQTPATPSDTLPIQTKLVVGPVGDKYEQEADRVAQEIVFRREQANTPTATPQLSLQRQTTETDNAVTPEIETSIRQAQGTGQALPGPLQNAMGQALGTDFSGVRVHDDSRADSLNHDLQARAFTTGQDIFFRRGEYNPNSQSGQSLLAHELTHVVQQGVSANQITHTQQPVPHKQQAVPSRVVKPVIQRLTVDNTQWEKATKVRAITGTAKGGVLVFEGDGDPVAVKPGEVFVAENIIAANLGEHMADPVIKEKGMLHVGKKKKEWSFTTPGMRIVNTQEEATRMYTVASKSQNLFKQMNEGGADELKKDKIQRLLEKLSEPGSLVMAFMQGEPMDKLTKEVTGQKKENILNKFVEQPLLLQALGRATAIDYFMGNGDRMIQFFAPQNMLVDTKSKTISLIDNIQETDFAAFTTVKIEGQELSGIYGLERWLKSPALSINLFINEDYVGIWKRVWSKMQENKYPTLASLTPEQINQMQGSFITGLDMGKKARLQALLKHPSELIKNVPEAKKAEAYYSIIGRKLAIEQKITDIVQLKKAIAEYITQNPLKGSPGHTTTTTTTTTTTATIEGITYNLGVFGSDN